jgi:hypothetical protein
MSERFQSENSGSDWILGAFKRNPEGILLLAAGAALLMRTASKGLPRSAGADSNFGVSSSGRVANATSSFADQTKEAARSFASSASDYADQAGRMVSEQSGRAVQKTQSAFKTTVNRVLKDQPLAIALVGVAAGAAVAAAFPATDIEKQALGPIGDQITETAERFGDQLKQATVKAGEKLKNAADQRGLNAEGLKEVAGDVAGAFTGSMGGTPDRAGNGGFEPTNLSGATKSYQP